MESPMKELQKRDELRILALAIMDRLKMNDYYKATMIAKTCYGKIALEQIKNGFYDEKLVTLYQEQTVISPSHKNDDLRSIQENKQSFFSSNKPAESSFHKIPTLKDISSGLNALGDSKKSLTEIVNHYTTSNQEMIEKRNTY